MWRFLAKSFFGGGKLQNFRHTSQISSLIIVQTTFYQTFTYFLTSCLGPKKQDFWPKFVTIRKILGLTLKNKVFQIHIAFFFFN